MPRDFRSLHRAPEFPTKYLEDILEAIKLIENRFYKFHSLVSLEDNTIIDYSLERNFAYEFYHQLRTITKYEDLVIDCEIKKQEIDGYTFPDITIHGGGDNMERQEVICEIKVKNHDVSDIDKLKKYCEKFNFKYGVWICANTHFDKLEKLVTPVNSFMRWPSDLRSRIIIIICNPDADIEVYNLHEIKY